MGIISKEGKKNGHSESPALDAKKAHFWINVKGQAFRKLRSLSLPEREGKAILRKERDLESCSGNSPVRAQHFSENVYKVERSLLRDKLHHRSARVMPRGSHPVSAPPKRWAGAAGWFVSTPDSTQSKTLEKEGLGLLQGLMSSGLTMSTQSSSSPIFPYLCQGGGG